MLPAHRPPPPPHQAITRARAMLGTAGVSPVSILHLLPPMIDTHGAEVEDKDVPASVLEDTEMMLSWMETVRAVDFFFSENGCFVP